MGSADHIIPPDDWLDQPLTPEEIATIRDRRREPVVSLTDEPPDAAFACLCGRRATVDMRVGA